ncbi:MAG: glutamine amidotransferase-related protein [Candidatus Bathyarchaeia archaeon]|jgi:GMP synthase (glutamine-hydrolysing)
MILVVDMNWKPHSLAYTEFVSPILAVVEPLEACTVKHYTEVNPAQLNSYSHIILSGTPLKDFAFLENLDRFNWLKTCSKPVLGICAGMQTILQVYGEPLSMCAQVGMTEITTKKPNPLFGGVFQAYTLHSYTAKPDGDLFEVLAESTQCIQAVKHKQKPLYGVLFHPEVRNPDILRRFVKV